jgi:hypothetical protein
MAKATSAKPAWWCQEDRVYLSASEAQVKALALKYKLTQGQVRGMIARLGLNMAKLDAEADRLRHR